MINNYCILISSLLWLAVKGSYPQVNTTQGMIEGTYFTTVSGRVINAFLGIPYALPQTVDNRLYNPKSAFFWKGVYPTKKFGDFCLQITEELPHDPVVEGSDNCLFLNIYTPTVSNTSKLEVLFFIHGGSFMKGSGNLYTPDFLMDRHNIVFITFNYRLGPLGFLSTEDNVISGNFGLKDQVLALQWVRKNIDNFGGDKDKITLLGEDAGAASVHLHYLSPLSRHLFKQGISLGGSALCPWALAKKPRLKAERLGRAMGCRNTTSEGLHDCFQKYNYQILMSKVQSSLMSWHALPFSPFGPVIEKKSREAFLYEHPHKMIEKGNFKDAPWLVGLTSHEGLYPGAKFARDHKVLEEIDEKWSEIAPILLDYNHTVPSDMLHTVNEKIREFYFEDREISAKLRKDFVAMLGDRFFVADTERAVRLQASVSQSRVFLYRFGYRGRYSRAYSLCKCTDNMGAGHGDDLLYLFNTRGYNVTETKYGAAMVRRMVDILISFMEHGIPKVDDNTVWKPIQREAVNGHNINFMNILTSQHIELENSPDLGNHRFWTNLHLAELKNFVREHSKFFDEL